MKLPEVPLHYAIMTRQYHLSRTVSNILGAGRGGVLHPAGESCPRVKRTLGHTSIQKVITSHRMWNLCAEDECREVLDLDVISKVRQVDTLLGGLRANETNPDPRNDVTLLGMTRKLLRHRTTSNTPEVQAYLEEAYAHLEASQDTIMGRVRAPWWRAHLDACHVDELRPSETWVPAVPWTPGMLVGARRLGDEDSYTEVLLDAIKEDVEGKNMLVYGTLGFLHYLTDTGGNHPHGHLRQVVALPDTMTPELLETILGTFDPGSDGPLGDLGLTIENARRLLRD